MAVAAAGVAYLLKNGGTMRLLVREIKELLKKLSGWQKEPLEETGGASPVVLRFYPLPPLNGARQP